jgi:hypothetical protein
MIDLVSQALHFIDGPKALLLRVPDVSGGPDLLDFLHDPVGQRRVGAPSERGG